MNHTLIPLYYCILCLLIHLFIHMPLPVLLNFQTEACFKICPIEFYVFLVFFFTLCCQMSKLYKHSWINTPVQMGWLVPYYIDFIAGIL